jgi:peroxiredoxin
MPRCWSIWAIVAVLLAASPSTWADGKGKGKQKAIKITSNLEGKPKDRVLKQSPAEVHIVPLQKGKSYEIFMNGNLPGAGFSAFLRLEDSQGNQVAEHDPSNDNSGGNCESFINFRCPKDDNYRIVCTARHETGLHYELTVKQIGALSDVAARLSPLSDKAAPDLKSDFAVNGKLARISDFKGKVVLLNFFAVQSAESVALLPRLCELSKKHKAKGLEVVGVTYYNSELGHKFGFDAVEGRLTKTAAASPQTDQALLAAFAAYHKLDYPLLILHKDNALKAYNHYLVNGFPQVVFIDRKGMVRFCFTDKARGQSEEVESLLSELLAER